jgi:hypothetical protein
VLVSSPCQEDGETHQPVPTHVLTLHASEAEAGAAAHMQPSDEHAVVVEVEKSPVVAPLSRLPTSLRQELTMIPSSPVEFSTVVTLPLPLSVLSTPRCRRALKTPMVSSALPRRSSRLAKMACYRTSAVAQA